MAQLRQDHDKFQALNTEVLVVVPHGPKMISRYVHSNAIPYPILSDKGSKVTQLYQVETRGLPPLFKVFTPSVFLVDRTGHLVYRNYTATYITEPDNQEPLAVLARLQGQAAGQV